MLYMTGEDDTLRKIHGMLGYPPETFNQYEKIFALANEKFLLATPYYKNTLPQYMPFYVTIEAFEFNDPFMDEIMRDIRKEYTLEERMTLRDLQEEDIPDECLELLSILSALRDEYEKKLKIDEAQAVKQAQTAQPKNKTSPGVQVQTKQPKVDIGGYPDKAGFAKDIGTGVLKGTEQLDIIKNIFKTSESIDILKTGVRDIEAAKNAKNAFDQNKTRTAHQARAQINEWAEGRLKKALEELKKNTKVPVPVKNYFKNELSSLQKGRKFQGKATFNLKTISRGKFASWGRGSSLRNFLRNAAEAARILRGAGQVSSLAHAGTSMVTKMPTTIQRMVISYLDKAQAVKNNEAFIVARKAFEKVGDSKVGGAVIKGARSVAKNVVKAFLNNGVMFGVGVVTDIVEEAINTGDMNRIVAAYISSTITGLISLGAGALVTAAVAKIFTTGAVVGLSMMVGEGIGLTILGSILMINPLIGAILILGTGAIVYYFIGDDLKKAMKEKVYQVILDHEKSSPPHRPHSYIGID